MSKRDDLDFIVVLGGMAYKVLALGAAPWACYWHQDGRKWVTSRKLTEREVEQLRPLALSAKDAAIYAAEEAR